MKTSRAVFSKLNVDQKDNFLARVREATGWSSLNLKWV